MHQKSVSERAKILQLLVEGNSIRGTARILDISKNTVISLLVDVGKVCQTFQDKTLRNLSCKVVQVDEMHSFVYAKKKNAARTGNKEAGDAWTWVAIDTETKLIPCWYCGEREDRDAEIFMRDLAFRMKNRIQLTSDGLGSYPNAVNKAFGDKVDFSTLIKLYQANRYKGCIRKPVTGEPDPYLISTSYIERQNLTMRMSNRRLARKTNAFSKRLDNHKHALALHFMYYNFCRIHSALRVTPAMAAGVSDHVWSLEEVVALISS